MKKLTNISLILAGFLILLCACDKEEASRVSTKKVTEITQTTAISGGNIDISGGQAIMARGVCWSTTNPPTVNNHKTDQGAGTDSFTSTLTDLLPDTRYYVRAYVIDGEGAWYGNAISFETEPASLPLVTTVSVSQITPNTALSGGIITNENSFPITDRGLVWSTTHTPTIGDNDGSVSEGTGSGSFTAALSDLRPFTTYYVRAYAICSSGIQYGNQVDFVTLPGTITYNGDIYPTVYIDNKEWFAKNLQTTEYNDGTPILNVTSDNDWKELTEPAFSWYNNSYDQYGSTYGALYNGYAVNTASLCPTGWRVPSLNEWEELIEYVGGESIAGTKLKVKSGWQGSNGTDDYGFSALPGGARGCYDGDFIFIGAYGNWWSTTSDNDQLWSMTLTPASGQIITGYTNPALGYSVRCVRDVN